ncbi:hypothetical protein JTE90_001262 [Oedothorax gibbosus]|uniref:Uncharacterized protein n=1 Tax=Oedothorax gibbosus TaxID=931172 RepID=A0AAV6VW26_9ARAC|nr:hypothetical protein JTE90_001262 [Oedothorax gibbosus]
MSPAPKPWGGMDSRQSWVVAVACFFVQVLTFGLTEASGLLFVATIPRFETTREKASLPFAITYCLRSAVGPLVSLLGRRIGIRLVTLLGCILSAISVACCFCATNILEFTLLWGVVFGISLGLETSLLNVILNEHFDKNLVKANGLAISGASLGTLLLSPVIEHSVKAYGLSGTFLIISGLMLNSIPAVIIMIINKPTKIIPSIAIGENQVENTKYNTEIVESSSLPCKQDINQFPFLDTSFEVIQLNDISSEKHSTQMKNELSLIQKILQFRSENKISIWVGQNTSRIYLRFQKFKPDFINQVFSSNNHQNHSEKVPEEVKSSNTPKEASGDSEKHTEDKVTENNTVFTIFKTNTCSPAIPPNTYIEIENLSIICSSGNKSENDNVVAYSNISASSPVILDASIETKSLKNTHSLSITHENKSIDPNNSPQKPNSKWQLRRLFSEPIYVIFIIGSGVYYFVITTFLTIIVDYATDLGIPVDYSTYIVMWVALCDIGGYMFQSWVIELKHMSQCHFASASFLCLCLASVAMTCCSQFVVLLVLICVFEVAQCGVIILATPLVAEYMDADLHATGIASLNILSSPMTLAISPLIGYFRDGKDSYDGVFYVISVCSLLCSLLFLCIPKLQIRRHRKQNNAT